MFAPLKQYDGQELHCVAHYPGYESFDEEDTVASAGELKVDKCE